MLKTALYTLLFSAVSAAGIAGYLTYSVVNSVGHMTGSGIHTVGQIAAKLVS